MAGTIDRSACSPDLTPKKTHAIQTGGGRQQMDQVGLRPRPHNMTDEQVEQFWQVNGPTMNAYGYCRQPCGLSSMVAARMQA